MPQKRAIESFGVTILWQRASVQGIRAIAQEAESLGLGYVWIPEAWGLEALSTVSHLLGTTSKIRIGAGVLNTFSRSAALIGMACVTLDQIAPGRFVLGLGGSGRPLIEDWHGEKFEHAIARTRDYVEVIRRVVRGDRVDYEGKALRVKRFRLFAEPMRGLEIYIGAIGERNLRMAGEISDGAIITYFPFSKLMEAVRTVGPGKKIFAYIPLRVTRGKEETEKAKLEVARNIAFYVASMGEYYSRNLAKLGYEKEVKAIKEAKLRGSGAEVTAAVTSSELIEDLSFVGSADDVYDKIEDLIPSEVIPVFAFSVADANEVSEARRSLRMFVDRLKIDL
jgi:5,10-methylenetetrahydromethanopterin reductase